MTTNTLSTAQRIRIARTEAGISQTELAKRVGMSQADISRIESGRQSPHGRTVDRILSALGASTALAAVDGALGIRGREGGKLRRVSTLTEAPPIEWLIEGLAARGAVTMIAGAPGAGKSLLTQTLGVAMAEATPLDDDDELDLDDAAADGNGRTVRAAGFDVHPGRVVVIDAENGEHLIQRRARAMGLSEEGADRYVVEEADGFDIEADRDALRKLMEEERPDLLILDSWTSLWSGSENSVDGVKRCLNGLRELAREYGLGVLLIHHTTKDGGGYRGSGAIAGTIEAVFSFTRDENGAAEDRLIFCEKMRLDAEPTTRRVQVSGHGVYSKSE